MARLVQTARDMRERLDYLIQELVDLENEVAWVRGTRSFDKRMNFPKVEPKRVAEAGELCTCVCECAAMNPALWSSLPIEVLQLVFARLPLPKIIQLRCLSGEWNRNLTGGNSDFTGECAQASHAQIFAMIPFQNEIGGLVSVRLFDTESDRWYSFQHQVQEERIVTMRAGDGGLVCLVSSTEKKKNFPLAITVLNLLTRQSRSLPVPNDLSMIKTLMVQLVMDHDAKCYKLLVVGEKRGRVVAKIYCSGSGVWRSAEAAFPNLLVFGHRNQWYDFSADNHMDYVLDPGDTPCAYDCAGRGYMEFDVEREPFQHPFPNTDPYIWGGGQRVRSYAFVKDRLFVLHEDLFFDPSCHGRTVLHSERFCVSEYQGQKCEPTVWVKLEVHRCGEFETCPILRYSMKLYACEGLLLIRATSGEDEGFGGSCACRHELTWLYDMSTSKWRAIPAIMDQLTAFTMFELRWDAVP